MRKVNKVKPKDINEILSNAPMNKVIGDNLIRAYSIINDDRYKNILCSVSGGQIVM